jgi:hypothetical protein
MKYKTAGENAAHLSAAWVELGAAYLICEMKRDNLVSDEVLSRGKCWRKSNV